MLGRYGRAAKSYACTDIYYKPMNRPYTSFHVSSFFVHLTHDILALLHSICGSLHSRNQVLVFWGHLIRYVFRD